MRRVKCPHCDDELYQESLKRHIRVRHMKLKPFSCSFCGKEFSSRTLVNNHELIHLRSDEEVKIRKPYVKRHSNSFKCEKCSKNFERIFNYEKHLTTCSGIFLEKRKNISYQCIDEKCRRKFVTKGNAAEHMREKHEIIIENPEKYCFECKKEFEDIKNHARSHNCRFQCEKVRKIDECN